MLEIKQQSLRVLRMKDVRRMVHVIWPPLVDVPSVLKQTWEVDSVTARFETGVRLTSSDFGRGLDLIRT